MRAMPRVAGEAFNLGGGSANAVSLIQILHEIELLTGRAVRLRHGEWRPGDKRWLVSDASKARLHLQLDEHMPWREGLAEQAAWMGWDANASEGNRTRLAEGEGRTRVVKGKSGESAGDRGGRRSK